uniref:Uncharacterized protein n=1 Tax=Cannabis sativa TaxID=3483 RepID=A0A803QP33_CANSA
MLKRSWVIDGATSSSSLGEDGFVPFISITAYLKDITDITVKASNIDEATLFMVIDTIPSMVTTEMKHGLIKLFVRAEVEDTLQQMGLDESPKIDGSYEKNGLRRPIVNTYHDLLIYK